MKNDIFKYVEQRRPKSSRFDWTHERKYTGRLGHLIPSCVLDCMAGDKLRINVENLVRFAPLVAPTLERMHVTNHFFFVPYRLVWPNFTKFLVGEDHEHPYYVPNGTGKATIAGYLGYPIETYNVPREMNPMFLAAYYLIYDEYYRDQNLQNPPVCSPY